MKPTLTLSILLSGCLLGAYPLSAQTPAESSTHEPAATARVKKPRPAPPTPTATPAEPAPTPREQSDDDNDPGRDRVVFGSDLTVDEGETVQDAVVFGGNLDVLGTVSGDAVCFGGHIKLGPHAVVRGDVVNFGGHTDIDPAAKIYGDTVRAGHDAVVNIPFHKLAPFRHLRMDEGWFGHRFAHRVTSLVGEIAWFAFLCFCALLLTVFVPQHLYRIEEHLTAAFPRSALMGLAALVGLPLVTLILIATCVGILLLPLLALATLATALIGYIAFAHVLGQRLLGTAGVFVQTVLGLLLLQSPAILAAIVALPGGAFSLAAGAFSLLGTFICIVVSFLGIGAVLLSRWGRNSLPQQQA
jgi:hypothetical protein